MDDSKSVSAIDLELLRSDVYLGHSLEQRDALKARHCRTCGVDVPTFKVRKYTLKSKYYVLVKWPDGHCAWIEDFAEIEAATDWIRRKSKKWMVYQRLRLRRARNHLQQ